MAPKQPKRGRGYTPAVPPNVDQWLWNDEAKARFNAMSKSNFFPGAFVKYKEFAAYRIEEMATARGLHSLLSFTDNNVSINHLLIKLFYANMGLDHHTPHHRENCIWTWVCGVKIFLPLPRLGEILQCPSTGTELEQIEVNMDERDEVSHLFLNDDMPMLRSVHLRPQARILHRALIRSVTPRTGSYEEVRKENFQALYAIYSDQQVNWASLIMGDFMNINRRRKYKTFHHGAYIMRILNAYRVPSPDSEFSIISELGARTLGLMGLERRPQNLGHITFQEWVANRNQHRAQPGPLGRRRRRQEQEVEEEEEEEEDRIQVISPETNIREAVVTLSRNQSKLETLVRKSEKKSERRFNSIRGFLNKIYEKIGCSGASSSQAYDPAPFQWSSSGNNGNGDEEEESSDGNSPSF